MTLLTGTVVEGGESSRGDGPRSHVTFATTTEGATDQPPRPTTAERPMTGAPLVVRSQSSTRPGKNGIFL